MIALGPLEQSSFLSIDARGRSGQDILCYGRLRELAKRLFCRNCDVRASGDKLCGRGLMWPKSGAGGTGFGWHVSGFGFTVFMEGFSHFYQVLPAEKTGTKETEFFPRGSREVT